MREYRKQVTVTNKSTSNNTKREVTELQEDVWDMWQNEHVRK